MTSIDRALLIVSIALAIRGLHRDGLLRPWHAAEIVERGADTMTLLNRAQWLTDEAEIRDQQREPGGDVFRARAAGMERLALEVLDAGGWRAVLAAAPAHARETWEALVEHLREAHQMRPLELEPRGVEIAVDMAARTMRVRMSLRSTVDRWWAGLAYRPDRDGHRWPVVGGVMYGDPRWPDGGEVMLYAVVEDERTAVGLSNLRYNLGRPA